MNVRASELLLALSMAASLGGLYLLEGGGFVGGLFAWTPLLVLVLFAFCAADGVRQSTARLTGVAHGACSPAALRKIRLRLIVWGGLWIAYLIGLEAYLAWVAGGGNLTVSVASGGLAAMMVAVGLQFAPRTEAYWTLAQLTQLLPLLLFALLLPAAAGLVYGLGVLGYLKADYLGMEFRAVVLSVPVAGAMLLAAGLISMGLTMHSRRNTCGTEPKGNV